MQVGRVSSVKDRLSSVTELEKEHFPSFWQLPLPDLHLLLVQIHQCGDCTLPGIEGPAWTSPGKHHSAPGQPSLLCYNLAKL